MAFSDIPVRSNGQEVDASWWNTIRQALVDTFESVSSASQNEFGINNNESSPAEITDMVFDKDLKTTYVVLYDIYRRTSGAERREVGYLFVTYKPTAATWDLERRTEIGDDALNNGDSITINSSTGQVSYISDNIAGTSYVGLMKWKVISSFNLFGGSI